MKSHRRSISPENPFNFYKIILSDETHSTGIRLPEKFTEEYGKYLSETLTLKVPNGDVWQVDLHKSGDEFWLKNGWGEFAERYGLGFSNLMMFSYEGLSTFVVIIFNASASEVEYPQHTADHRRSSVKLGKRKCTVSCDESKTTVDDDNDDDDNDVFSSSLRMEDQEHGIKIDGECSTKAKSVEEGRQVVEEANDDFNHEEPFMVYINKSHLTDRGVFLPVEIKRKLLGDDKDNKCLLMLKNDGKLKAWEVVAEGGYLGNAEWLKFVEDNGVKVGDICVLEPIHRDKNILGVTVFKSSS